MREKLKTTDRSDSELIEACLNGDPTAFEPLVERYQNFALALVLGHVRNYHDAQEIVQEAFIKAYCKLVQLKDRDGFPGWFRSIVLNGCYTWLSRQSRAPILLDVVDASELEGLSLQRHRIDALQASVWDAVYALPEMYRTVVLLHYMNDYSYDEIAQLLDVSVTTVKGRLQQARLKLKREFLSEEKEMLKMSRTGKQFTKGVQDKVTQIATKSIREEISLGDTDHLVLFCGTHRNDIEVRQHDKETVEISGTGYSVGHGKADAQRRADGIQIFVDTTENYWTDGPHPIERFWGSNSKNKAEFISGANHWQIIKGELEQAGELVYNPIRKTLSMVTRVTVGRENGEDILVPRDEFTDDVRRVFVPNRWSDEGLHGPPDYMNLAISIPSGKRLTIIDGFFVRLTNLRNDVNIVGHTRATLEDVEGTFHLYDCHIDSAKNVQGKLIQYCHRIDGATGGLGEPYVSQPSGCQFEAKLQNIVGELHLDVGKASIEASDIEAKAIIKNRFGSTRFYQTKARTNGGCDIYSSSGDVLFFIGEQALGTCNVNATTFCGRINYNGLRSVRHHCNNNTREIYAGTLPRNKSDEAEIKLRSDAGEIQIETIPVG